MLGCGQVLVLVRKILGRQLASGRVLGGGEFAVLPLGALATSQVSLGCIETSVGDGGNRFGALVQCRSLFLSMERSSQVAATGVFCLDGGALVASDAKGLSS